MHGSTAAAAVPRYLSRGTAVPRAAALPTIEAAVPGYRVRYRVIVADVRTVHGYRTRYDREIVLI